MKAAPIGPEWRHLETALEAIQRNSHFLTACDRALPWPLTANHLSEHRKDVALYTDLAAFNERFGKLQDSLGHAMRHAAMLAGEPADRFLKILAFYEKVGVLADIATWQALRMVRNQAAHDYSVDDARTAAHFNAMHDLLPDLLRVAIRFVAFVAEDLATGPLPGHFVEEFKQLVRALPPEVPEGR